MKSFVHLHMHTQYSLLNSTLRVENVVARAKEWEMPAIAQTDFGNMFGAIDFYSECREQGVNPILGCEVYVASSSRFERNPLQDNLKNFSALSAQDEAEFHHGISRLLLLCKNNQGYQNLCQIISKSYLEGQHVRPCVDSDLLKQYAQGLIAITPSLSGEVGFFLRTQQEGKALQALLKLKAIFTDDFYVGIQRLGEVGEAELNSKILKLTQENEVQIVATNECHYLEKEEAESHEVLLSIQTGNTILDEKRPKHKAYEYYFKSAQEMWNLYADLPEACENTLKIAEKCKVDLKWKDETGKPIYHLPQFKVETKEKLEDYFKRLGREGLQARFEGPHFRNLREAGGNFQNHYNERLEAELEMIIQMGFAGYFLIVADFINWAKDKGIPVGPGRGSGAGSLVAYALRITNIDPINFNLLFERFINPERVSLPDFDVDFCQHRRDEVIHYVNAKYGKDKVGQIITFGKLQARAVIRDVSRVFALPYQEADALAKLVPEELGITLEKAFEKEGKFKELEERDPKIRQILKNSRKLEGLFRHASIHAAGIIITNEPLVNYCPLYIGKEGEQVVQFDKDYAEKIGLVKFDFLGLKTLTVIEEASKLIRRDKDKNFDIEKIDLEDKKIYEFISTGKTAGVFQLESAGMKDLCKRVVPQNMEDITAINALFRPGPLESGMVDDYIEIKHGRKQITYPFPELETLLKDTYGVIVYQEQVMSIARIIAGYTLGQADMLRRAMGKKKADVMKENKKTFAEGAAKNGFDEKKAGELFDKMAMFAEYGFNKSHAVAYAFIAYQTAYLKYYYPAQFFAALLSTEMHDTDKISLYIADAKSFGIHFLPPDVNTSVWNFDVVGESIGFGMGAIKNVGENAVKTLVQERIQNGNYQSFVDFCERLSNKQVNKRVLESLLKVGAFDHTHEASEFNRKTLLDHLESIMQYAGKAQIEKELGQSSFFEVSEDFSSQKKLQIQRKDDFEEREKLQFEMDLMGMYVSGHPLDYYKSFLEKLTTADSISLQQEAKREEKKEVIIAGIICAKRSLISKKGDPMAFITLEDLKGKIECVVFPKTFKMYEYVLNVGEIILMKGQVNLAEEPRKFFPETIEVLKDKIREKIFCMRLDLLLMEINTEKLQALKNILEMSKGSVPLQMFFREEKGTARVSLGKEYTVEPTPQLLSRINALFARNVSQLVLY